MNDMHEFIRKLGDLITEYNVVIDMPKDGGYKDVLRISIRKPFSFFTGEERAIVTAILPISPNDFRSDPLK